MAEFWLVLSLLSLTIWLVLVGFRGQFWRSDQRLSPTDYQLPDSGWPAVCAIVPARNEAAVLPTTLRSLLQQDYPGPLTVVLVDDQSTDGTAQIAAKTAQQLQCEPLLQVIETDPLPPGWSGKLWAVNQGIQQVLQQDCTLPDYFLLSDADICHNSNNLRDLVSKAQQENLDLVSLMVLLRCDSVWERLLIPAFVFFFEKLYPFRWVNDSSCSTAAAAGGCMLVEREALRRAGGIAAIREALIDDCALAEAIQSAGKTASPRKGKLWLGLTTTTHSLRAYTTLESIWTMVARTAFTQLHYSPWLLLGTLIGMGLVYMVPPASLVLGLCAGFWSQAIAGALTWSLMTIAYWPTVRLYKLSPLWTLSLPITAILYTLMTLDSALRYWRGQGGAWKGRVYPLRSD